MNFLQWFYNPFKPHICRLSTGEYVIRRFNCLGWECLASDTSGKFEGYWWNFKDNIIRWSTFPSRHQAEVHLERYRKPKFKYTGRVE